MHSFFGTELPIIQAPMAGAQDASLAVAVCNAGGLGSLPCAVLGAEALRVELASLVRQTSRPFNVNFFCHEIPKFCLPRETAWRAALSPYYQALGLEVEKISAVPLRVPFNHDAAEILTQIRPAVVSFHFGLPSPDLMARVRALGSKIISSATTIDEARWLEAHGAHAIIAQGLEAGGHRGMFLSDDLTKQMGIFSLLPQVVKAVNIPVIAAGGIADSRGVRAAMELGASGVQIGTAYLLCPEATTSPIHRAALRSARSLHTALTNLFTGWPARGIINRLMEELGPMNALAPAFPLAAAALAELRAEAERHGRDDFSPLWCGQNASQCREIAAADLTHELGFKFR